MPQVAGVRWGVHFTHTPSDGVVPNRCQPRRRAKNRGPSVVVYNRYAAIITILSSMGDEETVPSRLSVGEVVLRFYDSVFVFLIFFSAPPPRTAKKRNGITARTHTRITSRRARRKGWPHWLLVTHVTRAAAG